MKFLNEEDAIEVKQKLNHEMDVDPLEEIKDYIPGGINWSDNFKTWEDCKLKAAEVMRDNNYDSSIFIAHGRDNIIECYIIILKKIPL